MLKPFIIILILFPAFLFAQPEFDQKRDSLFAIARNADFADSVRAEAYIELTEVYYVYNLDSLPIIGQEGIRLTSELRQHTNPTEQTTLFGQESELINNIGLYYYRKGQLESAVTLWYESLKVKERLGDKKGQANVLNNIANIQLDLGDIDKSEQSFLAILSIQKELDDSSGIARSYNVLGYIERTRGNDSLALVRYTEALKIRLNLPNKIPIAGSLNNVAYILKRNKKYEEAIIQYNQALAIYKGEDNKDGENAVLTNLANCYFELGSYNKALSYASAGFKIATELGSLDDLMYSNEILYKINDGIGNHKATLTHYIKFITLRDSLDSEKNYKALINQEMEYEFQKKEKVKELEREKEREFEALKHENDLLLSEERSFRLKLIVSIVSVGLLAVILLLYFISKQLRISENQKKIIEKQNKEIEMKALRSQMNPHFLFNSLNSIKHFIVKNEAESAASYLTKFAKLVRLVLENSSRNLISLEEELTCIKHYLELEKLRFNDKFNFEISGTVHSDFIQLPPLILQPFIENAIWHGILNKEDGLGLIEIKLSESKSAVCIEIIDNGIGRKKALEIVKAAGTDKKSVGLMITLERLQVLNRLIGINSNVAFEDLYAENNEPSGTKVTIIIPYHD